MNKIAEEYDCFPNGQKYFFNYEKDIIRIADASYPSEVRNKTLFVTGLSGVGKTTAVSRFCEEEGLNYKGQVFLTFPRSKVNFDWDEKATDLEHLAEWKVLDGHFLFNLPYLSKDILFAHDESICRANYDSLKLGGQFEFNDNIKKNFIFEIKQLPSNAIIQFREQRFQEETRKMIPFIDRHSYVPRTSEEIRKGEYVLYQAAHQLYEQGLNVYIRNSLEGAPLRFAE